MTNQKQVNAARRVLHAYAHDPAAREVAPSVLAALDEARRRAAVQERALGAACVAARESRNRATKALCKRHGEAQALLIAVTNAAARLRARLNASSSSV